MRCWRLHVSVLRSNPFRYAAIIKCVALNLSVMAGATSCDSAQASPAQPASDAVNLDQYFFLALEMQRSFTRATVLHISLTALWLPARVPPAARRDRAGTRMPQLNASEPWSQRLDVKATHVKVATPA